MIFGWRGYANGHDAEDSRRDRGRFRKREVKKEGLHVNFATYVEAR